MHSTIALSFETYYWTAAYVSKQVAYMAIVGTFPFNSFLSGVLSCIGTAVLAGGNS
jgi:hypothetical protein